MANSPCPPRVDEQADQRRKEIAELLARAILRLNARNALTSEKQVENLANSGVQGLEIKAETALSVHTG